MGNPAPDSPSLEIPIQNAIASCKPPFLFPLLTWPQDDQTASKKLDQFHPTIPSASVVIPTPPLISAKDSDEQLDVTNDTLLPTMPSFPTPKCSFCGNCTILGPFSAFAARSVVASRGNVYIAFACAWGDVEAHVSARVDVLEDKSPSRLESVRVSIMSHWTCSTRDSKDVLYNDPALFLSPAYLILLTCSILKALHFYACARFSRQWITEQECHFFCGW